MTGSDERKRPIELTVTGEECGDPVDGVERDEALMARSVQTGWPQLRLWFNAPCIVVGRGYARTLPRPVQQVFNLPVLVRSSGGQVVIHGPGVLNVSLAVPALVWTGSIDEAFAGLSTCVERALRGLGRPAAVGVVPGSYCPGDHDLSVDGRKVMGISQRRRLGVTLVHGSLNVAVVPSLYAYLLTRFYRAAGIDEVPQVGRIGTLHSRPLSPSEAKRLTDAIVDAVLAFWSERVGIQWVLSDIDPLAERTFAHA